ncbi:Cyclic nucleotide-binding domain-containing protein [Prosthecobacter debontii]|uniref:Cyclic nucleotide-binding domain-containing protein n=1 Tax=Prosthecobacter debontii TaxID=48467 RepID=A0A1T4Z2P2_9BACT|nr:cyclic nucleotide-binding domain-containing protein [Prosthecobacter debontii]SKB08304.1 Cyclic nucleotide-binding domain-containing protein [Prosthecobacter debontii]
MKEYAYIHEDGQLPAPLSAVPFLNSFTEDQLDEVLNSSSLLQCDEGDTIIREGSIDSRIYILLSGELEVKVAGKKVAVIGRAGDVFGELALVNQDKRAASVIAGSRALCLAVDQKFLQDIHPREEDPAFHAALFEFVARLVARKLDATSRRLAELEKELKALKGIDGSEAPAKTTTAKVPVKGKEKEKAKKPTLKKAMARR